MQAGGQFQIEGRQQATLVRLHQVGFDLIFRQNFHLPLFHLRQFAAPCGVHQNQPFRYRLFQAVVQQGVDTMHHSDAQPLILQFNMLVSLHPAILLEVVVKFLDLDGSQLIQLDVTQLGDDVLVDVVQVVVLGFLPEPRLSIDLVPHFYPAFYCVGPAAVHIQPLAVRDGLFQLFFDLRLGLAQHVLELLLSGFRVIIERSSQFGWIVPCYLRNFV